MNCKVPLKVVVFVKMVEITFLYNINWYPENEVKPYNLVVEPKNILSTQCFYYRADLVWDAKEGIASLVWGNQQPTAVLFY